MTRSLTHSLTHSPTTVSFLPLRPCRREQADLSNFSFLDPGWKSLLTILEHLKDAPAKRGNEMDGSGALAKRFRGVDLGG